MTLNVALAVGCSPSGTDSPAATDSTSSNEASQGTSPDATVLMLQNNTIENGQRKKVSFERIDAPSEEQLLAAFDSLPWNDEKFSPYLGFGRSARTGLKIRRPSMETPTTSIEIIWNDRSGDLNIDVVSKPIASRDVARKILIAFYNGEDLTPLAEWQKGE